MAADRHVWACGSHGADRSLTGTYRTGRERARGADGDGRAVVQKHLAFAVDGTLMSVSILRPVEALSDTRTTVQTLLGDLTVEIR